MNGFNNIETRKINRQTIVAPQYGFARKRPKSLQMKIRRQRRIQLAEETTSASVPMELL